MNFAVPTFEEAAKVALCVDSAIWGSNVHGSGALGSSFVQAPTLMKTGSIETRGSGRKLDGRRLQDYRKNACFTCYKVGCRPWKHQQNGAAANNFEVDGEVVSDETEEDSNYSEN